MRNIRIVFFIALSLSAWTVVQGQIIKEYSLQQSALSLSSMDPRPLSNSITEIRVNGDTLWLGTGKGLSMSPDRGVTWKNFYGTPDFGTEDVSAIAIHKNEIWVATAHSVQKDDTSLPEGSGIRFSADGGRSWRIIPQPLDVNNVDTLFYNSKSTIRALGITTAINNITYDIAPTDSAVWIASFAGMARKSTDKGLTWQRVIIPPDNLDKISPSDSLKFDLSPSGGALGLQNNLNHRAFSVLAENDSIIWIGSAGGINRSTDMGRSWSKFTRLNQLEPISGNFVVALSKQSVLGKNILWAATVNAEGATERRGISFSSNNGVTWETALIGEFAHNIAVNDSAVYVVSDNGIFRSSDFGSTWMHNGTIADRLTNARMTTSKYYSAAAQPPLVWFGGTEGLCSTKDGLGNIFGKQWSIARAFQSVASAAETYAYPNPFAPDDESVRIHYKIDKPSALVSIRIFDFGMNLVRTVMKEAIRMQGAEFDELWNGNDENGRRVTNGTYFYQIQINNESPYWGKILVIQ